MIRILSLGGGVQSTCIARMSFAGDLPPLDHIIFADTGAELPETYEHVQAIERACHNRGIGFHRVTNHYGRSTGNLFVALTTPGACARWASPPLYIDNSDVGERTGQTKRQCTGDYKTDPIDRKTRELCGVPPRARGPRQVVAERWLGISADEKTRMKASPWRWMRVWHPLIERPEGPMFRAECITWLKQNGHAVPPKSACFFCPYQSDRRWIELKRRHPDLFRRAVALDSLTRGAGQFRGEVYYHRSARPLAEAIEAAEHELERNPALDFDGFEDECSGVCGV